MKRLNFVLLLLVLFSSCLSDTEELEKVSKRSLLVYLAGDNNLSNEVAEKSKALLSAWKPHMGELFVFGDVRGKEQALLMKAVHENGMAKYDTLKTYPSANSASKGLLEKVIADFKQNADKEEKKRYGLVLFSHATGWLPGNSYDNVLAWKAKPINKSTRSVFDDQFRQMEISDLAAAIPDGMFDFIAADMCFMAGVEVAYALRNKTPYILASSAEILSPGFTPTYAKKLHSFYKPTPALEEFATSFFQYFNGLSGAYKSATISIIKTSELERLSELVKKYHTRFKPEMLNNIQAFDRKKNQPKLFFDLGDYLRACAQTDKERKEIEDLLKKVVVFKQNTKRLIDIQIHQHSGMTIYLPQDELTAINKEYRETEWFKRALESPTTENSK